jgi:hypothetical protein
MADQQYKTMNRIQRRARKLGEQRISGEEIWRLVDLSKSRDPNDRLEAADNLCPCHVRRRVDAVWDALYRLLEDPDVQIRKAAFHTLTDGGDPDDPALDPILERARKTETDRKLRRTIERLLKDRKDQAKERAEFTEQVQLKVGEYPEQGKCDFCGDVGPVKKDYDTAIPASTGSRPAMVCAACD